MSQKLAPIISENHKNCGGFLSDFMLVYKNCSHLVCAYIGEQLVGFVGLDTDCHIKKSGEDHDLHIMQIGVKKSVQGQGVASELLKYVENHSLGFNYISSDVNKRNLPSRFLFEHHNYKGIDSKNHPDTIIYVKKVKEMGKRPFHLNQTHELKQTCKSNTFRG